MAQDNRTPNWSCIVYEDSLPSDWIERLEETTLEVCVSPWHDKDVWTKADEEKNPLHIAGEPKKKHRHVVIMYGKGNKKSKEQVMEDFGFLNGTQFKKVKSLVGIIQYLDHRFCINKHHYDEREVISLNGFDYDEIVNTPSEKQTRLILKEIRVYCRENSIYDFCDIQDIVDDNEELTTWAKVLDANQFKIANYITSRRCKKQDEEKRMKLNPLQMTKEAMMKAVYDVEEIEEEAE